MAERRVIEIAGVPIEITYRSRQVAGWLDGYETDKAPVVRIAPTDKDLETTKAFCRYMKENENFPVPGTSDVYYENVTIESQIAEALVSYGVLRFHGSALSMDGEGYVFTAPSGTGKSTHARLWREAFGDRVVMINDDMPFIRFEEDVAYVCGAPWNGKHQLGTNAEAPLKAVVLLNRGEENRIEKIGASDAFPFVFKQAHNSADPALVKEIMTLEQRLLKVVQCFRLHCNMSSDAALVAWRGMNE